MVIDIKLYLLKILILDNAFNFFTSYKKITEKNKYNKNEYIYIFIYIIDIP